MPETACFQKMGARRSAAYYWFFLRALGSVLRFWRSGGLLFGSLPPGYNNVLKLKKTFGF